MAVTHTIDGTDLDSVRIESVSLVGVAELGNVGQGSIIIDDPAGVIAIVGHKDYSATEDDCASPLIHKGFIGQRAIRRGPTRIGPGRQIEVTIHDLNELLNRRVIRGGGKRPRESVGARMTWILGSSYLSSLVVDNGFVVYPSTIMDANDYRYSSRPGDVIGDCATRVGFNFFVYPDETTGDPSLFFADANTSTLYSSSLQLSNLIEDIDWTTTFPVGLESDDFTRDPVDVASGVELTYAGGRVYRTRTATATAFVTRDAIAPTSSVKRRARAITQADKYLVIHSTEEDEKADVVLLPSSQVNLLREGMRVQCRYQHLGPEGYDSFTWFRVLERRTSHVVSPGGIPEYPGEPLYSLGLRLSPQEAGCIPATIVQSKAVDEVGQTGITFDNPVTIGNLIVAIGVRRGDDPAAMLGQPGSNPWIEIEQVLADKCCLADTGSVGTGFVFALTADSTSGGSFERAHDSGHYQWRLYEIAGSALGDISFLSASTQAGGTVISLGTFSGTTGAIALMVGTFTRGTDQRPLHADFGMGAWTERFDNQLDPTVGEPISGPWVGIGDTTAPATASWTMSISDSGQSVGEWAGIALLCPGTNCT